MKISISSFYQFYVFFIYFFNLSTQKQFSFARANVYSLSEFSVKRIEFLTKIRKNTITINAVKGNSVTLSCSIDLDDGNFSKSENYKVSIFF